MDFMLGTLHLWFTHISPIRLDKVWWYIGALLDGGAGYCIAISSSDILRICTFAPMADNVVNRELL